MRQESECNFPGVSETRLEFHHRSGARVWVLKVSQRSMNWRLGSQPVALERMWDLQEEGVLWWKLNIEAVSVEEALEHTPLSPSQLPRREQYPPQAPPMTCCLDTGSNNWSQQPKHFSSLPVCLWCVCACMRVCMCKHVHEHMKAGSWCLVSLSHSSPYFFESESLIEEAEPHWVDHTGRAWRPRDSPSTDHRPKTGMNSPNQLLQDSWGLNNGPRPTEHVPCSCLRSKYLQIGLLPNTPPAAVL